MGSGLTFHKNLIIVHGLGLKMIPAETLGRIADVLGWKNLPALGWSKSVGRKFYDQNRKVSTSNGQSFQR